MSMNVQGNVGVALNAESGSSIHINVSQAGAVIDPQSYHDQLHQEPSEDELYTRYTLEKSRVKSKLWRLRVRMYTNPWMLAIYATMLAATVVIPWTLMSISGSDNSSALRITPFVFLPVLGALIFLSRGYRQALGNDIYNLLKRLKSVDQALSDLRISKD